MVQPLDQLVEDARALVTTLEGAVLDASGEIAVVAAAVLSGGHVLLEDRPGVGKTTLAKALAASLGADLSRIQGTPDLMPTDITGVHVFQPHSGEWSYRPGPVVANVLLIDEFNRATPKAQSALLEAMAERQVTVDVETVALPNPFVVIATQNPMGEPGTHPLVHAQLDRFAVSVGLGLPGRAAARALLRGPAADRTPPQRFGLDWLADAQTLARTVPVSDQVIEYILDLVDAARVADPSVWLSGRVPGVLLDTARGHAIVSGRSYVAPDDVQAVATAVIEHRLPQDLPTGHLEKHLDDVPVPTLS